MQKRLYKLFILALSLTLPVFSVGQAAGTPERPENIPTTPDGWHLEQAYELFALEIATEEKAAAQLSRAGKDPSPARRNYSQLLRISRSDEEVMRIVLYDAFQRVQTASHNFDAERQSLRHDEVHKKTQEEIWREAAIYMSAVEALRQQLSKDDFQRLQTEVLRRYPNIPPASPTHAKPAASGAGTVHDISGGI